MHFWNYKLKKKSKRQWYLSIFKNVNLLQLYRTEIRVQKKNTKNALIMRIQYYGNFRISQTESSVESWFSGEFCHGLIWAIEERDLWCCGCEGVLEDKDNGVSAQEHLGDKPVLVHGFTLLLSFSSLWHLSPHLFNLHQHKCNLILNFYATCKFRKVFLLFMNIYIQTNNFPIC